MPDPLVVADSEIDAALIQALTHKHGVVVTWSVTWGTTDHGERFIARPFLVTAGKVNGLAMHLAGNTLGTLRAKLPPGLTRTAPQPDDDPVIVEIWL